VLDGEGGIELDGEVHAVSPGHVVYVPPGTVHRAVGELTAVIVCTPPFDPADEFTVSGDQRPGAETRSQRGPERG